MCGLMFGREYDNNVDTPWFSGIRGGIGEEGREGVYAVVSVHKNHSFEFLGTGFEIIHNFDVTFVSPIFF